MRVYDARNGRRVSVPEGSLKPIGDATVSYSIECIRQPLEYRRTIFPLPGTSDAHFLSDAVPVGPGSSLVVKYKRG